MTSAPALVITPITRRADHAETDGLERLWVAYKREDTRRRWSQAVGGLVWAAAWTAVAAGLWRSGTASMYAPAIQLLALTGWLAVLPALEGTLGALLIRSALLGGAVGLVAVPFLLDAPRNGLSISVVIALSLFLSGLAFRGLRNEMRSRHEQLWTAVLDGHSYLLTDDANALRWFIARNAGIGAFLTPAAALAVTSRLSARDSADLRVICAGCYLARDTDPRGVCPGCGIENVLVLYSPGAQLVNRTRE